MVNQQVTLEERARQFHRDQVLGADYLRRTIGYNATRFQQMLGEVGGVETARRLLNGPGTSDGFGTLWEHGELGHSVEASVLLPWYAPLFTEAELAAARRRLEDHEFDVEAYLGTRASDPPSWTSDSGDAS